MNKATSKSTLRYCAKQAYQLFIMRGLSSSSIAGHYCTVFSRPVDGYVKVHGAVDAAGEFCTVNVPIAKSWAAL